MVLHHTGSVSQVSSFLFSEQSLVLFLKRGKNVINASEVPLLCFSWARIPSSAPHTPGPGSQLVEQEES